MEKRDMEIFVWALYVSATFLALSGETVFFCPEDEAPANEEPRSRKHICYPRFVCAYGSAQREMPLKYSSNISRIQSHV